MKVASLPVRSPSEPRVLSARRSATTPTPPSNSNFHLSPQKMSTANGRTSTGACLSCQSRKVRCVKEEGAAKCNECTKRSVSCEPRANRPQTPCDPCKRAHLGCDWPGRGPCTHCARAGTACSFAQASPSTTASPPPSRKPWMDVVLGQ
ncbi:hypothetical protein C8Q73DRAFT_234057 [Cubamyces lactineus]|nr:hypothetical protein C8Q73DRAFT_234057 [Cubamyces lactineus]